MRPALAIAALSAALLATPASAGQLEFSPYVWIPGIDGTIGTGGGDSGLGDRVELDFTPEFRIGGAMVNLSWREGRYVLFGDWTYANVRAEDESPFGLLYSGVSGQIIGNVVQLFSGYALVDREDLKVDAYLGVRGWGLVGRLGLDAGTAPAVDLESSGYWLDAAVGFRVNWWITPKWFAHARADVGAGGSNVTWQAYALGAYRFSWGALFAGWRHLYVDRGDGDLRLRLALSGPVVGASFSF